MKKVFTVLLVITSLISQAQNFTLDGYYRPRVEYRDLVTLPGKEPISIASHRLRLILNYKNASSKIITRFVLQDARVWQNKNQKPVGDNNSFSVYEAWGQYFFTPNLSIKVGRQELSYDNKEIFSNSNDDQQGRSHDAAIIKYSNKIDIELAGALNNNTPMLQLTKAPNMQFLRISKNGKKFSGNLMIVNNGLEYYNNNSVDSIRTNYYQTLGVYFKLFLSNRLFTTNSFYYQTGKDQFNLNLNAYSISSKFSYVVKPKSVITSIGINVFSGNNKDTEVDENNSYSFPYGSFFNNAGLPGFYTLIGPKGKVAKHKGLIQPKAEIMYLNKRLTLLAKVHVPFSYGELYDINNDETGKSLGTEFEVFASFQLSKDVKLSAIVGHYMMGKDMEYLSHPAFGNYASYERNLTWVIIGLTFTPNIFKQ